MTDTEHSWLDAALPVLKYAQQERLPLDIVVQPQPTPGEAPMGMAFVEGRCKLVLSMRGNAEAQATLDRLPPGLLGPVVEAIAAHELGHCWRHLQGAWGTVPADLQTVELGGRLTAEQSGLLTRMWRIRREEAYADLVGLAWTLKHHPADYDAVHAWHLRLRADPPVHTSPHDTRVWVRLAGDRARFAATDSIFDRVLPLWRAGLLAGD